MQTEFETRVKRIISINNKKDLPKYLTKFINEILTENNKEWSKQHSEDSERISIDFLEWFLKHYNIESSANKKELFNEYINQDSND